MVSAADASEDVVGVGSADGAGAGSVVMSVVGVLSTVGSEDAAGIGSINGSEDGARDVSVETVGSGDGAGAGSLTTIGSLVVVDVDDGVGGVGGVGGGALSNIFASFTASAIQLKRISSGAA